ncbi:MAG: hypothetical protein K1Y02_03935 [Candidatus Hydrogenedentes bacterium]|nr:hypothetical protein [Candidatus Hydrogenedentota bacterium]
MKRAVLVSALILLAAAFVRCNSPITEEMPSIPGITSQKVSDEDQIAAVLTDIHQGIQSRRIFKVLAHISRSYSDPEGMDYTALQNYLNEFFKNYKEVRVTRVPPRVFVQGTRARVVETFGTRAEPFNAEKNPPLNIQGQVNIYLEKVNGEWQITEWSRVQ